MSRIVVLDKELCNTKKCSLECQKVCPVNRKGDECIKIEKTAVVNESLCIGCSICTKKCPFSALSVVNLPEELKEEPIIQFGKNSFRLFRLPIPVKGVVGLLGPNGTGKTTALKILSGQLKPSVEWKDLIKMHRGSELQDYLERLADREIECAYKPQILAKAEKVEDSALIKKLELENCLGRKAEELSGGELQRLAIAATIEKEADIYYFDEPSSFLDVRQRLNVAKAIRELAENKFVVAVEHDLATLDFLADRIHIFYGTPSVYGIVSKPYVVRNGINTFLGGYIKEDNVRIRDPVVFQRGFEKILKRDMLVSFSHLHKSYGSFELKIEKGEIYSGEVLGILGPNGIGKTTFAKMLAGIVDFEGSIDRKIKISYKPQYLEAKFGGKVREIVSDAFLINQLNLEKLLEKNVKNLSGGELQRVAIALCLSQSADLYLLDEPSAYMDVDQRLAVAKLIQNLPGCRSHRPRPSVPQLPLGQGNAILRLAWKARKSRDAFR